MIWRRKTTPLVLEGRETQRRQRTSHQQTPSKKRTATASSGFSYISHVASFTSRRTAWFLSFLYTSKTHCPCPTVPLILVLMALDSFIEYSPPVSEKPQLRLGRTRRNPNSLIKYMSFLLRDSRAKGRHMLRTSTFPFRKKCIPI